jgi:two-component system CheB/CheR fusion protein
VRVSDSGVGIRPEHLRWVFEPFWQVDQSVARTQGGLGLGLTLVKSLVELHGGEVSVRSEGAGRGSEFSVSLPVAAPAGEHEGALPATPTGRRPRQLDVVVADDNRDAADSLAMLLGTLGHTVRVAYDGGSALALIESWMPQLALLDIGMPGLDGYELARRIRAASWGHRVRLVALTGWGQASDVERARAAGFDAHLTKPAELLEIEGVLALAGR